MITPTNGKNLELLLNRTSKLFVLSRSPITWIAQMKTNPPRWSLSIFQQKCRFFEFLSPAAKSETPWKHPASRRDDHLCRQNCRVWRPQLLPFLANRSFPEWRRPDHEISSTISKLKWVLPARYRNGRGVNTKFLKMSADRSFPEWMTSEHKMSLEGSRLKWVLSARSRNEQGPKTKFLRLAIANENELDSNLNGELVVRR